MNPGIFNVRNVLLHVTLFLSVFMTKAFGACVTTVNSYPYIESWETGPAGWSSGGTNNDWTLGAPVKPVINAAGDGTQCWITGGLTASFYNLSERSFLESPCFNFSGLVRPEVSFLIWWETEYQFDGGNLQYSLDGGTTWETLGNTSSSDCISDNWYNINSINNLTGLASPSCGWAGTVFATSGSCRGGSGSGQWVRARFCLRELAGLPSVKFRFTFGSGTTCNNFDGLAVDAFEIRELTASAGTFSYSCTSSRTVTFTDLQTDCRSSRRWDFGDGITESNSAITISHTYLSEGNYTVTLSAEHECLGTQLSVNSVSILSLIGETYPVSCEGGSNGSIGLSVLPSSGLSNLQIAWNDPGLSGDSVSGLVPGAYPVTVTADKACAVSDTFYVGLSAGAFVEPSLGADTFFCPDNPTVLKPGMFSSYLWQDGTSDSMLTVRRAGQYWVTVTTAEGCTGSDTVNVDLNCLDEPLFPSAFTPNEDLKNDVFIIFPGVVQVKEWFIFDRWGQEYFHGRSNELIWDGKDAPEGVYVLLLRYTDSEGEEKEKIGRVTVVR